MRFRDAVPDDVERLATLARRGPVDADVSPRSLRDMVHDRTVVVAERERGDGDGSDRGHEDDGDGREDEAAVDGVVGYVSYDVEDGAVVVHHLVADVGVADGGDVLGALLERPLAFADSESLPVVVGLSPDEPAVAAVEEVGFEPVERRRFGDDEVVRYERSARDER